MANQMRNLSPAELERMLKQSVTAAQKLPKQTVVPKEVSRETPVVPTTITPPMPKNPTEAPVTQTVTQGVEPIAQTREERIQQIRNQAAQSRNPSEMTREQRIAAIRAGAGIAAPKAQEPNDSAITGLLKGAGKSLLGTFAGASSLGERAIGSTLKTLLPKEAEKFLGVDDAPTLGIFKPQQYPTAAEAGQADIERSLGLDQGSLTEARGTAQQVGKTVTDIGQFFLPMGAVGRAAKVAEATAAARGVGRVGQVAAGLVPEVATDVLLGTAQSKGDISQGLGQAGLGLGAKALAKGVGYAAKGAGNRIADASKAKQAAKEANEAMLSKNIPDSRVADKMIEGGRVVPDRVAKEAIRQGIDAGDVALIKGGSATDKRKMLNMLDIREGQITNKRITDRATDIVGDTFVEKIAKPLEKLNRAAGVKLDAIAKGLKGKIIDPSTALNDFASKLETSGVSVGKGGKLGFKGSDFEGIKAAQTLIENAWKRAIRLSKTGDAYQAHQLKRYIDELVEYGKAAEGLSGRAQGILKSFRHNIDAVLDKQFSAYNKANTQFSETIQELDRIGFTIGKRFKMGEAFADAQAGVAMRKLFSNTQSRSELLKLLENSQNLLKKHRIKIDDDIITQASFADLLEKMLGTEAPTSLMGQTERAIEGASALADIGKGRVVSGSLKAGKSIIDMTRGVSNENRIKALRELLKREMFKR